MRTSSSDPAKKPAAVPVELSAVPIAACAMLSDRAGPLAKAVASSTPFKYNCTAEPLYVTAAWYHTSF